MHFPLLAFVEVHGIALQYMRLIGAENIDVTGFETLHTTARDQRAFAFDDPGDLCFIMTMKVVVKMRQNIFLNDHGMFLRDRQCELDYFHFTNISKIRVVIYITG